MFIVLRSLIASILLSTTAYAAVTVQEFSADAVVTIPGQPVTKSKLFIGKNAVRTEIETQNGLMIDIVYPAEGRLIKLNPEYKKYLELTTEKQTSNNTLSPCNKIKNASCTFMGNETVDGRQTQKWQMVSVKNGQQTRSFHWIDTERQLAIREFFTDGSLAEMKFEKNETLNGRKTEKWIRTVSRPDGSLVSSYQWYDPVLEISTKEELPGGYIRELNNIKVGKQKASLFSVPEDYSRIMPANSLDNMNPQYRNLQN